MDIKLVAVDMDGTLLKDDKSVSKANLEAIRACLDIGCKFILSSGRPIQGIRKYKELEFIKLPIICYNGCMIVDKDNNVLYKKNLIRTDANKIFKLGLQLSATMCIWANNILYTNKDNELSNKYRSFSGAQLHVISSLDEIKDEITKFVFYNKKEVVDDYLVKFSKLDLKEAKCVKTDIDLLEIFNSKVSKATAIKFLEDYYHISNDNVLAIGDANNDIEMIDYVKFGIAMENATDKVKSVANYITKSNNENGVSYAINKFILNK